MLFKQLFDKDTCTYTYLLAGEEKRAVLIDPVLEYVDEYTSLLDEYGLTLNYVLDTHVHADHVTAAGALCQSTACKTAISIHAEVDCADIQLSDGMVLTVGSFDIQVLETPGHTPTCLSFLCEGMVFTGDAGQLYDAITKKLFVLPEQTVVYPGHDYHGKSSSTIAEQKEQNPRLKNTKDGFVELMNHLNLPNPKRIEEAVPANQACGKI